MVFNGKYIDTCDSIDVNYFSFYPVLSCLWDGAYKRTLAANRKE